MTVPHWIMLVWQPSNICFNSGIKERVSLWISAGDGNMCVDKLILLANANQPAVKSVKMFINKELSSIDKVQKHICPKIHICG